MSYTADGSYDVYRERRVTARKKHTCGACGRVIERSADYYRITWVYDGGAGGCKRCLACQLTHEHLRGLCRSIEHDMWPDEWLSCGRDYEDEWGSEPPPEIAALAFWDGDPATLPCT